MHSLVGGWREHVRGRLKGGVGVGGEERRAPVPTNVGEGSRETRRMGFSSVLECRIKKRKRLSRRNRVGGGQIAVLRSQKC